MLVFCRLVGSNPDGHQYGSPTALYKFVYVNNFSQCLTVSR